MPSTLVAVRREIESATLTRVYCPSCRQTAATPWQHASDCIEGLRAKVRFYEAGIPIILVVLLAETALLAAVYFAS